MKDRTGEENNIYLGSFLPAKEHDDELVMWRTYGKNEAGEEAAGCSIAINAKDFFDGSRAYLNDKLRKSMDRKGEPDENTEPEKDCLYRVLYYDRRKKTFNGTPEGEKINQCIADLRKGLREILAVGKRKQTRELKPVINTVINTVINKVVYHILSEVRHFFKSADYAFENELRVIQFVPSMSKRVKIEDGAAIPRRMYIESSNAVWPHIRQIITGPKVPYPERWMYLEARMKKQGHKTINVKHSETKYQ